MIDELHVKDVALIREATLYPARGLTVITGETGAGKTALLSALKLLSGERAEASMVREGAPSALVEGRVFAMRPVAPTSADDGGQATTVVFGPDGLVASRTLTADGRSRVHIDGSIAGVGQLAATVGSLVDLCGQHEHQRLLKVPQHRVMLDSWAQERIAAPLAAYAQAFEQAQEAARAVDAVRAAGQLGSDAVEQARFVLRRIDEVDPQEGEYEELCASVPKIENAEALMQAVSGAHAALSDEGGTLETIGQAAALLESMAHIDETLGEAAGSLREASYIIEDVARDVRSYRDDVDYDAEKLVQLQERMGDLQGLMRSWGPTMSEVMEAHDHAAQTVAAVEGFEEQLAAAQVEQVKAEESLAAAAKALHSARAKAAPGFAKAVTKQMARLELADARLECSVDMNPRDDWAAHGPDHVEFQFRPGAGLSARPLGKIASGGEVSRVMLAIKVVLGAIDDVETLVFDEVDAGVGGSAARALADVLVDLAKTHQVIVVTHLPQVAVAGDVHYVVEKTTGKKPETAIETVEDDARVAEIARMLSGDTGKAALDHAAQMLGDAAREASEKNCLTDCAPGHKVTPNN